ncbi:LysM peptidoglycan-binding domain-containing protein [Fodinibius sediminis]|uniref:Membrane-bound lytic murein transglycosylase D n=1 Tax=Fodinibius sediminis TaxID=1214077 RepID=A0A521E0F1_9BACT|nr:LysM peptidoglycan-binding domain-containing protein [Fodinibius sediminis]SMO77437.1 membrane-bound lytic murein transglycosylase D [Fodinibius sediminis]
MQKKLYFLLPLFLAVGFSAFAQQADSTIPIKLKEVPVSPMLLPYNNPLQDEGEALAGSGSATGASEDSEDYGKSTMQRIAQIYKIQVQAIEAQLNEDPLKAEQHITDALNNLQALLDKYPEIQSDQRFSELYRSVMTEYRKFYGVTESETEAQGEIFAIQKELFSDSDDWMKDSYSIPENLPSSSTRVPLVQNDKVNRSLMYFSMRRPEVMERWLKRSEKYFPMMERIFEEEGVPTELIHLSMVESGLNPRAQSWASAVGMWQFIRGTGSVYGLDVNWWVDERRDPVKATRAAAQHLKDLYEVWNDWHLALAAYNISPRGLNYAIRRGGGEKDYWSAWDHLPRETRNYVPSYIAATMIGMNPESFGFEKRYDEEPYSYDIYRVAPLMPLDVLAEAAGITLDTLKEYNPELLRWATPPGDEYPLKLPAGRKELFAENYKEIPQDERGSNIAMHTVSRGESLGVIARKYGTSVRALYETNESLSSTIYPGQKIVVPLAPGSTKQIAADESEEKPEDKAEPSSSREKTASGTKAVKKNSSSERKIASSRSKVRYEVRKGDTIGHIAEWFDVSSSQIRVWNNTSNTITPGEYLDIYVSKSKESYYEQVSEMSFDEKQEIEQKQRNGTDVTEEYLTSLMDADAEYTVRRNDTLIDIANKFGVPVSQIKQLNGLNSSRIRVGQKLKISSSE